LPERCENSLAASGGVLSCLALQQERKGVCQT
jgi:hypothetical protein